MNRPNPWLMPLVVTGLLVAGVAAYLHHWRTPTGNAHQQRLTQLLAQRPGWRHVHVGYPTDKHPDRWTIGGTKHGVEFRGECRDLDPDKLACWVYLTESRPGVRGNECGTIAALFFNQPDTSWTGQPLPPEFHREMARLANELHGALQELVDLPPRVVEFPRSMRIQP